MDTKERERREISFWYEDEHERPSSNSVENILNKAVEARLFWSKLDTYSTIFADRRTILELGAGQCWASCLVKRKFPRAYVHASDISPAAIASAHKWESIFGAQINQTSANCSYEIPLEDQSVDLAFAFQAAHHFTNHQETFAELSRVLGPGGVLLYLSEPVCSAPLYSIAHKRVNSARPCVPEDVLIWKNMIRMAGMAGFRTEIKFQAELSSERTIPWLYRKIVASIPILHRWLITSADMVFRKRNE